MSRRSREATDADAKKKEALREALKVEKVKRTWGWKTERWMRQGKPTNRTKLGTAAGEQAVHIYAFLLEHPGKSLGDIANEMRPNFDVGILSDYLRRMTATGFLEADLSSSEPRYHCVQDLEDHHFLTPLYNHKTGGNMIYAMAKNPDKPWTIMELSKKVYYYPSTVERILLQLHKMDFVEIEIRPSTRMIDAFEKLEEKIQ